MRSLVWVLDPKLAAADAESIVAGLAERDVKAAVRDLPAGRAIVVDDPPDGLAVPAGVVRSAGIDLPSDRALTRRAFLDAFAGALALSVVGAGVGVAASFAAPPPARNDDVTEVEAGTLTELRQKGSLRFRFGREPCIVVLSGTKLFALSLVCTHLGCLVEWSQERRQLLCPCHRAAFDVEGNVLEGPPPRPLDTFHVTTAGDRVLVRRRSA
jgi:cytochrome b6-f complex iron-sulfur subunit